MRSAFIFLLLFFNASFSQEKIVFQSKEAGYDFFRIPAIVQIAKNHLMAFAEGRVNGSGDFGNIDIVYKTSKDGGISWSNLQVLIDNKTLQAGNPAPVMDLMDPLFPKGILYLFYNTGNNHEYEVRKGKGVREVWLIKSTDHGRTWSDPFNITLQVHRPHFPSVNPKYIFKEDWRSYANAPGHALQVKSGKYAGRLLVPANHSFGEPLHSFQDYRAHAFYSDDHGKSFQLSANVDLPGSNESIAAEISNGGVLMNIRNQFGSPRSRILAYSSDGGMSWDTAYYSSSLKDPVCQGSMIGVVNKKKEYLLFSNATALNARDSLSIHVSKDDGHTWKLSLVVTTAPAAFKGDWSAYSDLVIVNNKITGILYERNQYKEIVFKRISNKKIID